MILMEYLLAVNLIGFVLMGVDKKRARKKEWRIPEKMLFLCAAIGGCFGCWGGMYFFRHKTKHWYFVLGMPLLSFAWLALLLWLWQQGWHLPVL